MLLFDECESHLKTTSRVTLRREMPQLKGCESVQALNEQRHNELMPSSSESKLSTVSCHMSETASVPSLYLH